MDWSKASDETVKEIVREGEAYIAAQLSLATSADQRASVMASIFTAAGAAIVAGLITLYTEGPDDSDPIFAGGVAAAALFLIGASLCVWAALPVGFDLPGAQPKSWLNDVETGKQLKESLQQQAENYQDKINDNRKVLGANASRYKWGAIAGIAAPLAGFVVWLITSFCAR